MEDVTLLFTIGANPLKLYFGVAGRGRPHLKLLVLVIPDSENPNGTDDTVFSRGVICLNNCPPFVTLRGCWQGEGPT